MKRVISLMLSFGLLVVLVGCGSPTSPNYTSNIPSDHTLHKGGVPHKPGLTNPTVNCVECHGSTLHGDQGPSCYSCHGQKW